MAFHRLKQGILGTLAAVAIVGSLNTGCVIGGPVDQQKMAEVAEANRKRDEWRARQEAKRAQNRGAGEWLFGVGLQILGVEGAKRGRSGSDHVYRVGTALENRGNSVAQGTVVNNNAYVDSDSQREHIQSQSARGVFNDIYIEHNALGPDNQRGLMVHSDFSVRGGLGRVVRPVAYFFRSDGSKLEDKDGKYTTFNGQVCASNGESDLNYPNTRFDDYKIFMPYSQLDIEPGSGRNDLFFVVHLLDKSGKSQTFGHSGRIGFRYSN